MLNIVKSSTELVLLRVSPKFDYKLLSEPQTPSRLQTNAINDHQLSAAFSDF